MDVADSQPLLAPRCGGSCGQIWLHGGACSFSGPLGTVFLETLMWVGHGVYTANSAKDWEAPKCLQQGPLSALWESHPVDTVGSCGEDGCCPQAELEGHPWPLSHKGTVCGEQRLPGLKVHTGHASGGEEQSWGHFSLHILSLLEFQTEISPSSRGCLWFHPLKCLF